MHHQGEKNIFHIVFNIYLLYQVILNLVYISYFPAHKTLCDFSIGILEKSKNESILIFVIYWKETGLLHNKISNHNIFYSS